jgi:hypothetical protein
MSSPRLTILVLPLFLGLALMAGGCAPAAVTAASYGADGVSLADTGKTTGDHFTSMVTKKDCAFWRALRNQNICREREGDRDPYQVNYNEPFRDQGEGAGVQYHAPLRATANAPVTSSDAAAYQQPAPAPSPPAQPTTAVAETTPAAAPAVAPPPAPTKAKKPKGDHSAARKKAKKPKPSPDQVAQVP